MDTRQLRSFVAVAEDLNFTRAAARLRTAQPGLSQQIRRLERRLGVELFIRNKRSVELTDAGRVFLEHARRILHDTEQARRAARQAAQGELGHLSIGFALDATGELLADILVGYRARHPNVDIALHELTGREQIDAIVDGRIQLGLFARGYEEPRLRTIVLRRQQILIALPAQHRLAGRRSLELRELADDRWVVAPPPNVFYTACATAGFEPLIAQQVTGSDTRLAFVASGVGPTLAPEWSTVSLGRSSGL